MIHNYSVGSAPAYRIASVDHVLQLTMLLWQSESIRLSDAAEYLGVARSTAHRLLAMLVFRGFVRQNEISKLYVRGPLLADEGARAFTQLRIQKEARPLLQNLAELTDATATLQVLEGTEVFFVDAAEPPSSMKMRT